jgi:hypothetical protein
MFNKNNKFNYEGATKINLFHIRSELFKKIQDGLIDINHIIKKEGTLLLADSTKPSQVLRPFSTF